VLRLTAEATAELIDEADRLRMREVHPDLAGAAWTDEAMLVNTAGEILREPTARARYDALRQVRSDSGHPAWAAVGTCPWLAGSAG
jgi:curved DNA-binding protein CbpA